MRTRSVVLGRVALPGRLRGFTLIELMVVLAVAAGLAAWVAPSFDKMLEGTRYRSALKSMQAELRQARQLAEATGAPVSFEVDFKRRLFGIQGRNMAPLPPGVQASAEAAEIESDASVARITFLPQGGASGGSIDLRRADGSGTRLTVDWLSARVQPSVLVP